MRVDEGRWGGGGSGGSGSERTFGGEVLELVVFLEGLGRLLRVFCVGHVFRVGGGGLGGGGSHVGGRMWGGDDVREVIDELGRGVGAALLAWAGALRD